MVFKIIAKCINLIAIILIIVYAGDIKRGILDLVYKDFVAPAPAKKFSDISDNGIYSLRSLEEIFVDVNSGNYEIKDIEKLRESVPDFEEIPLEKIGRVN